MKSIHFNVSIFLSLLTLISACKEDSTEIDPQPARFSLNLAESESGRLSQISDSRAVVITIANNSGETILDMEKITLYNIKGKFISEPIELLPGAYNLIDFLVVDEHDNVLYIAPKEGADKAELVFDPLPIPFEISGKMVNEVAVQVLPVEGAPQVYGYASFNVHFKEEGFSFSVQSFILNEGEDDPYDWEIPRMELTAAHIEIYRDEQKIFEGELGTGQNIITIEEGSWPIKIRVTKESDYPYQFYPYEKSFSRSELEGTLENPLQIILRQDEPFKQIIKTDEGIHAAIVPSGDPNRLLYTTSRGLYKIDVSDVENPGDPVFIGPQTGFRLSEDLHGTLYLGDYYSSDLGDTWTKSEKEGPNGNFVEANGIHFGLYQQKLYKEISVGEWEYLRDLPGDARDITSFNNKIYVAKGRYVSEDGINFQEVSSIFYSEIYDRLVKTFTAAGRYFLFVDHQPPGAIHEWIGDDWSNNSITLVETELDFNPFVEGYKNHLILVETNFFKAIDLRGCEAMCQPHTEIYFNWNPETFFTTIQGKLIGGDKLFIQTFSDDYGRTYLYAIDLKKLNLE